MLADFLAAGADLTAVGFPEQQCGPAPVGFRLGAHFVSDASEGLVERCGGDRALRDVDQLEALAGWQEPDWTDLTVAGLLKVRGDFGSVTVAKRGGDHGIDGGVLDAGESMQEGADLFPFPFELPFVSQVLVLAAAFDEDIEEDVGSCTSSAMAQ